MSLTVSAEYVDWAISELREQCDRLGREVAELREHNHRLQELVNGLAARVAAQSELLGAAAERAKQRADGS